MDNLTHSLVGAWMAQVGLKRTTPLATATLVLGANLPDVDGFCNFAGEDTALLLRRGWTHGVLAMLVLPWVLAGAMVLWDKHVRRRRHPEREPVRFWALLGLSFLSILSHPFLDWLNTYGVRLLMPFDGRWFYGDALFIIDPWVWLLMAASVVMADARARASIAGWCLLGAASTALILLTDLAQWPVKALWLAGVVAIVLLRVRGRGSVQQVAILCGVVLGVYLAGMLAGTALARWQAERWLREQGLAVERVMAGPLPANPFARDVIALGAERYHFVEVDWLGGAEGRLRFSHPPLPREEAPGPIVEAALAAPQVRGFRNWLRFPTYQVSETEGGYRVRIQDVRYSRTRSGIGTAVVDLDHQLRPH